MKNLAIFSFFAVFLIACNSKTTKEITQADNNIQDTTVVEVPLAEQLEQHIAEQLASGERNDEVILDFKFGMTKKQVGRHTQKLIGKKKLKRVQKTRNSWEYVYYLRLKDIGKLRTNFDFYYTDGGLYKAECRPKLPKGKTTEDILMATVQLFEQKYGEAHFVMPAEGVAGCERYLWIENNLQIELTCNERYVLFTYTDLSKEQIHTSPNKKENNKQDFDI